MILASIFVRRWFFTRVSVFVRSANLYLACLTSTFIYLLHSTFLYLPHLLLPSPVLPPPSFTCLASTFIHLYRLHFHSPATPPPSFTVITSTSTFLRHSTYLSTTSLSTISTPSLSPHHHHRTLPLSFPPPFLPPFLHFIPSSTSR